LTDISIEILRHETASALPPGARNQTEWSIAMAEDWAADVKKYVPDADDGIIAGIVRYCGIALQKRDSSLVAFSDPKELSRVRENFLKKKLGLTQSDAVLGSGLIDHSQNMTVAAIAMADKKACAHRS